MTTPPDSRNVPDLDEDELDTERVVERRITIDDFEAIRALQLECFPGMPTWKREHVESQLEHFPEGQIGIEIDGRLVASSASLIVKFDLYSDWHDWGVMADDGYIRNHDPEGDTLYGIEIMVHPDQRGRRLSRRLYEARKEVAREFNLSRIMIGGRIPGYTQHAHELSAQEYVDRVVTKELHDPVLTAQFSNGFELRRLIPNYLPSDAESAGYATFLEWTNLDYRSNERRALRPVHPVRLALVQYEMRRISSFEEFAQQCEYFVDVGGDYRADFVLFPELLTTQLLSFCEPTRPGLAARSLAEFTERYLETFGNLAVKYNVNIIGGSQFSIEDGELFNIAYLFRRDGSVGKQYKIHITPSERQWWGVSAGDSIEVFDTDAGRIAIVICYDVEFPELCRVAAKKGAQILFVPFNTNDRHGYLRVRLCAQARAIENHVFVAITGCTGNLPLVENADIHYAQSAVFTPSDVNFARDGVAIEATPNIETVLVQEVDIEMLRRHRYDGTTQNWNDRRRDLYRVRFNNGEENLNI